MEIDAAVPTQLLAISALQVRSRNAAFRPFLPDDALDPWTAESWAAGRSLWLQAQHSEVRTWVVIRDRVIAGFCDTGLPDQPDLGASAAEIHHLYVDPGSQSAGVGAALLRHGVSDLQQRGRAPVVLWTHELNLRARNFYERHGWKADGATRAYIPHGLARTVGAELRYRL